MTVNAIKVGRVGWRWNHWDELLTEAKNDERFPANTTYVLLERTEHIVFVTKAQAVAEGLFELLWTSGHVFNETWELNWEKQDSGFLLRLLTEGDLPGGWEHGEFEVGNEISLLLFGERKRGDDPGWREARIPRWLEYPVEKIPGRACLVAIPYLRQGMVMRMRLKEVKAS